MKATSRARGAVCLALVVTSCGPTAPSSGGAATSAPTPSTFNLTGEVFENVNGIRRPIEGVSIGLWGVPCANTMYGTGCTTWYSTVTGTDVVTDSSGRYIAPNVPGSHVTIVAGKSGYLQACAASGDARNASSDVELVSVANLNSGSAQLQATTGARVSGTVFETTPDGPKGILGAFVYAEPLPDLVAASTYADANGHFSMCNLAAAGGMVTVAAAGFTQRVVPATDGMSVALTRK